MVLGREGEQYTRADVTEEDLARGRSFFERIQSFLTSRVQLLATEAALDLDPDERSKLVSMIGRSCLATALLAAEEGSVLYSDDRSFRELASERWHIRGTATQSVLKEMLSRDVLTPEAYQEAIIRLVGSNYYFISVGADDIVQPLRRRGGITPDISRMFEVLQGPDCTEESAARIGADILRGLYLDPGLAAHRSLVTDAVLAAVVAGREPQHALAQLDAHVGVRFMLMPLQRDEVSKSIRLWAHQN